MSESQNTEQGKQEKKTASEEKAADTTSNYEEHEDGSHPDQEKQDLEESNSNSSSKEKEKEEEELCSQEAPVENRYVGEVAVQSNTRGCGWWLCCCGIGKQIASVSVARPSESGTKSEKKAADTLGEDVRVIKQVTRHKKLQQQT